MDRRHLLTAGVAAVVVASAPPAAAQAGNDPALVGSWFGTVTATHPPLGQFNDLISFSSGGVVTESRRSFVPGTPLGNLLETTGLPDACQPVPHLLEGARGASARLFGACAPWSQFNTAHM